MIRRTPHPHQLNISIGSEKIVILSDQEIIDVEDFEYAKFKRLMHQYIREKTNTFIIQAMQAVAMKDSPDSDKNSLIKIFEDLITTYSVYPQIDLTPFIRTITACKSANWNELHQLANLQHNINREFPF